MARAASAPKKGAARSGTRTRAAGRKGEANPPRMEGEPSYGSRMERDPDEIKVATPEQIVAAVEKVIALSSNAGRAMSLVNQAYTDIENELGIGRKSIKGAIADIKLNKPRAMRDHLEATRVKVAMGIIPPPADDAWTQSVTQAEMSMGLARGETQESLQGTVAYEQGYKAGFRGRDQKDNPYNVHTDSIRYAGWARGQGTGLEQRHKLKPETANTRAANASRQSPDEDPGPPLPLGDLSHREHAGTA